MSVSPVSAFLREEVCAVSDHLAAVSLFNSEEWMTCLIYFTGWTDTSPDSEARLRALVSKLYLKPLAEHGDIESPLLRSQIDEQFLRAMAAARSQMDLGSEHKNGKGNAGWQSHPRGFSHDGMQHHMHPVPNQVGGAPRASGFRRPRYPYAGQWWGQHQNQSHYGGGGDDNSAYSSLSGDAFSEYGGGYQGGHNHAGHFYPPMYHHPTHAMDHLHATGGFDPSMPDPNLYPMHAPYHSGLGYYGHAPIDPSMAYAMHHHQHEDASGYYGMPATAPKTPEESFSAAQKDLPTENKDTQTESDVAVAGDQTPFKHGAEKTPRSPYWGHLDSTIAMGLATPQTHVKRENVGFMPPEEGADTSGVGNAQPLLLRQSQYYGYGPVNNVS